MHFKEWLLITESVNTPMMTAQYKKKFPNATEQQITQKINLAAAADPTPQKKYTPWIFSQILPPLKIRLPEDTHVISQMLSTFHQNKQQIKRLGKNIDIGKYDRYTLADLVDELQGEELKSQRQLQAEVKTKGAEKLYDDGTWTLIKSTTPEACVAYAKGTKWCTSKSEASAEYLKDGPLYQIFKDKQPYAQIHFGSGQLMDTRDKPIEPTEPMIKKFVQDIPVANLVEKVGKAKMLGNDKEKTAYIVELIKTDPKKASEKLIEFLDGWFHEGEAGFGKITGNSVLLHEEDGRFTKDKIWIMLEKHSVFGQRDSFPFQRFLRKLVKELPINQEAKQELKIGLGYEEQRSLTDDLRMDAMNRAIKLLHNAIGKYAAVPDNQGMWVEIDYFEGTQPSKPGFAPSGYTFDDYYMDLNKFIEHVEKGSVGSDFQQLVSAKHQDLSIYLTELMEDESLFIDKNKLKEKLMNSLETPDYVNV